MPPRLMLDPSLLLSTRTFRVLEDAWELRELEQAVIPSSFFTALREKELSTKAMKYFGARAEHERVDLSYMSRETFVGEMETYHPSPPRWTETPFSRALRSVIEDKVLFDTLMEEWEFLTSQSWVVSRLRRPFTAFLKAGGVAIEWGGRAFDQIAARTLKTKQDEIPNGLRLGQRMRAVSKWIAVGGLTITPMIAPLAASVVTGATGFFLLFDP